MLRKLSVIFEKVFSVFFIIMFLAIWNAVKMVNDYMQISRINYMAFVCVLSLFICIIYFSFRVMKYYNRFITCVFLFTFAIFIRLVVIYMCGLEFIQISDFYEVTNAAELSPPIYVDKFITFSNYILWVWVLHIIYLICGECMYSGVIFNVIINALSVVLLYLLLLKGMEINLENEKAEKNAMCAALLFCVWPSALFYTIILTPEHLNILLVELSLYLLFTGCKNNFCWYKGIFAAVLLAVSGFFKSIDSIMLIALGILIFLVVLKEKEWISKKNIFSLVIFISIYFITKLVIFQGMDIYAGMKVNRNPSPNYIYIGLQPDGKGMWRSDPKLSYSEVVRDNQYNYGAANSIMLNALTEDISEQGLDFGFFYNKFLVTWQTDNYLWLPMATIEKADNTMLNVNEWNQLMIPIVQYFWSVVILLCLLSSIYELLQQKRNHMMLLTEIFLFGFFLVMLIIEVQTRYKYVCYPYIAIIASNGIAKTLDIIEKLKYKVHMYVINFKRTDEEAK